MDGEVRVNWVVAGWSVPFNPYRVVALAVSRCEIL